jgi:cytochrome P450
MRMHGITGGPFYDWWMNVLMGVPLEDHSRLRGLVNRAFTPRMIETLRPFMRTTAERLADELAARGDCDFVEAFAEPLPTLIMCELLGVPTDDYDKFHYVSNDIGLAFSRNLGEELAQVEAALGALSDYVGALIEERRAELGDDLISTLIKAEEHGNRLSEKELNNLVLLLVWAGQDTTARQLGRALVVFAEHPEQWTLLGEHPELAAQAVEEVCRWSPQARTTWRFAATDVEFHGLEVPAGTWIMVSSVAANRDPRAFADPERFDITVPRKARQLAFGGGIHNCLGAGTARVEMAEGLVALAQRLGPPTVTGPITWRPPQAVIHGPDELPLRFAAHA